jgi:hypothetical protein
MEILAIVCSAAGHKKTTNEQLTQLFRYSLSTGIILPVAVIVEKN